MRSVVSVLAVGMAIAMGGCGSDDEPGGATGGSGGAAGSGAASSGGTGGSTGGSGGATGGVAGSAGSDGGVDAGPPDPCGGALFCETFDDYPAVSDISDKQLFGPWRAALTAGATMKLDGTHTSSGASALHVHVDDVVKAGGRLFADGNEPIFKDTPTHVYGRLRMYIDPNGTSVHWTFFGVSGDAEPSSPAVGRNAQYILSSLAGNSPNTYSFVYGLQAQGSDGYHDCSSKSKTEMPTGWACISFELDSVARKLRMYKDGATDPILSVDDHGNGCVAPTDKTSPWYGPAVSRLFVGAWSFHEMKGPLDVWIDDLVVDTKPVACPAP